MRVRNRLRDYAGSRWHMVRDLNRLMTRGDRRRVIQVLAISLAVAGSAAATGISQRWVVDSALHRAVVGLFAAVMLGAVSFTLTAACSRIEWNLRLYLIERFGILLNREVVRWSAGIPTLEHLDDPRFLDRSAMLRFNTVHLAGGLSAITEVASATCGVALTAWLLVGVHPVLALLVLLAVAPIVANNLGQRWVRKVRERVVSSVRLEQRLHDLVTRPESAKEVLVSGSEQMLSARATELWRNAWRIEGKASLVAAGCQVLGWVAYIGGLVAALAIVSRMVADGTASLGEAVLVLSLGTQLLPQITYVNNAAHRVALAGFVTDYYRSLREQARLPRTGDLPAPKALRHGITLRNVSFGYGGSPDGVLRDVNVHLPAGATVAVVGINGAGKSTLVKLLSGMYQPKSGWIEVDGVPLDQLDPQSWRSRVSAAFQDATQFQLRAHEVVRIGDLSQRDHRAVVAAVERAGAADIIEELPEGYQTQLGTMFGGVDLSGGQWQRLAMSRACMRRDPILLLLDEPTAAMDPAAEHLLFERFTQIAAETVDRFGAITVLVTHRYSTVRDADLVIVLDGGRITEQGRHEELMEINGRYAELYRAQAQGYL